MVLDPTMYQLIMNSNQIVHNRGKALSYLAGADKKRKADQAGIPQPPRQRHQYKRKNDLNFSSGFLRNLNANSSNSQFMQSRLGGAGNGDANAGGGHQ